MSCRVPEIAHAAQGPNGKVALARAGRCKSQSSTQDVKQRVFWLNSLQLPEEALERLWRGTGHLVPAELDELVSFLENLRKSISNNYESLTRDYDSYVSFCKSINVIPEDPHTPRARHEVNGLWEFATPREVLHSGELVKEMSVGFAGIDKMRALDRTLRDTNRLIGFLAKVKERFADAPRQKSEEVRLYVFAHGRGLAFQLVYEFKDFPASRMEKPKNLKGFSAEQTETVEVQKWIDFGLKALAWRSKDAELPLSADEDR